MFTGLQQRRPPKNANNTAKLTETYIIKSGATLLATEKRLQHTRNIKNLLNLPPKLYQRLYQQVIVQFAEFTQELPETVQGAFASAGGFLDHGLERASRALSLCLAYFFPEEKNFQQASTQQSLWIYAVFTAALLYDVGKLGVKYQIDICKKDGTTLQTWLPYTSSMVAQGKYYKYDFLKENRDNLRRMITPLLARQILAEAENTGETEPNSIGGFNWIASNPDVLEAWLALLSGDIRSVSAFLTVIPLADAQTIENHIKMVDIPGLPTDQQISDAFLQWLRDALEKQQLSVNETDSLVHLTQEGVLIDREIFKTFSHENPQYESGSAEQQFREQLKVYQSSIGDMIQQHRHIGSSAAKDFILIANPALLFQLGGMPMNYSQLVKIQTTPAANLPPIQQKPLFNPPAPK